MTDLQIKALKEAADLLNNFEGYKFHDLIKSTKSSTLLEQYTDIEHTKIHKAML